jgi:hypothetical protein
VEIRARNTINAHIFNLIQQKGGINCALVSYDVAHFMGQDGGHLVRAPQLGDHTAGNVNAATGNREGIGYRRVQQKIMKMELCGREVRRQPIADTRHVGGHGTGGGEMVSGTILFRKHFIFEE